MTETPLPPASSGSSTAPGPVAGLLEMLRGSQMLRLLAIGALVLLLQIPIAMIEGVIQERSWRRSEAVADVQAKWGGEQHVAGPRLVVPVTRNLPPAASPAWNLLDSSTPAAAAFSNRGRIFTSFHTIKSASKVAIGKATKAGRNPK